MNSLRRNTLLLTQLIALALCTDLKAQPDTIRIGSKGTFYLHQQRLNPRGIETAIKSNSEAFSMYRSAKGNRNIATVLGGISGFLMGSYLGAYLSSDPAERGALSAAPLLVGGFFAGFSVPLSIAYRKGSISAVERYNADLKKNYDPTKIPMVKDAKAIDLESPKEVEKDSGRSERRMVRSVIIEERAILKARIFEYPRKKKHVRMVQIRHGDKEIGSIGPGEHLIWVPPIGESVVKVNAKSTAGHTSNEVGVGTEDNDADLFRIRMNKQGEVSLIQVDDHLKHEIIDRLGQAAVVVQ